MSDLRCTCCEQSYFIVHLIYGGACEFPLLEYLAVSWAFSIEAALSFCNVADDAVDLILSIVGQ